MATNINDGVVPLLKVELLGGARNGHHTLALLLMTIHVDGIFAGGLAETLGPSLTP